MLSSLFKTKTSSKMAEVADLFSRTVEIQVPVIESESEVEVPKEKQQMIEELDEKEDLLDREGRVVFVGNLEISTTSKEVEKLFSQYGQIEKVWFRSVPVDRLKTKMPIKAAVITKKFLDGAHAKNCYILFKEENGANNSIEANNMVFKELHLRVDLADKKKKDLTNTVFLGNLPFHAEEEQLRNHCEAAFGEVEYCRLIRDRISRRGKGFGYVKFRKFEGFKKAVAAKTFRLDERDVRVSKALPTKNSEPIVHTNASNATQRIQSREKTVQKEENKKLAKQRIQKQIKKIKKNPLVKPKEVKIRLKKIRSSKKVQQDTNIFNRQKVTK